MIKRGRREFIVLLLEMFVHITESVCVYLLMVMVRGAKTVLLVSVTLFSEIKLIPQLEKWNNKVLCLLLSLPPLPPSLSLPLLTPHDPLST